MSKKKKKKKLLKNKEDIYTTYEADHSLVTLPSSSVSHTVKHELICQS